VSERSDSQPKPNTPVGSLGHDPECARAAQIDTLHSQITRIGVEIHQINQTLEAHLTVEYPKLVSRMNQAGQQNLQAETDIEELASALLGPKRSMLQGGGRESPKGLVHKVEVMWGMTQNGGVPAKLRMSDRVAIYVALISAVGVILAGAFGAL